MRRPRRGREEYRLRTGRGLWRSLRRSGWRRTGWRRVPGRCGDRGSVLALVPAGFLVLVVLGALAVDSAVAYSGQQQLHDALAAAANDAVGAAVDDRSFYGSGRLTLDPGAVDRTVCATVAAQGGSGLHAVHLYVAVAGDSVRVWGRASVDAVFGRALPGYGQRTVRSSAEATLATAPVIAAATAFGPPVPVPCG